MKRSVLCFSCFFVLCAVTAASDLSGPENGYGRYSAVVRVGSDHDYPPYEFIGKDGKPTGFNVELIKAVCEAAGLKAEVRLGVWDEVRTKLSKGDIDVIAGMYFSQEREKAVDFSMPHNRVSSALFVRNDSDIVNFGQAKNREIIVQKGDIMHDHLLKNNFTDRIVTVADPVTGLSLLAQGKYDGVLLSSRIQGYYFIHEKRFKGLRALDTDIPARRYCFAVRKGAGDLVHRLNEGLSVVKLTGKYQALSDRWFGVYVEKTFWETSKEFAVAIGMILVLLVIITGFTWFLRNQVKRRTRELLISERRYRHLVQNASDILSVTDDNGYILYINPIVENIMGYKIDDMMGKRFYNFVHPDYLQAVASFYQNQFDNKLNNLYHEFPVIGKDGATIWLGQNSQILENEGVILGFQAIARDITERKKVEDDLRKNRQILLEEITERKRADDERKHLAERLQRAEKMEALGTLAGGVAHDLNNVLGILVGYSELLLDDIPADSPFRAHVEQIMKGGMRAAAIVQDLLTMARRGVQTDNVVNLNTVIAEFMGTPEGDDLLARNDRVRFEIDLAPDLLKIKGSQPHLFKTILNLMTNAVEAMNAGGTLALTTSNRHLERQMLGYDTVYEGDYVVLTVSDTGEGIAEEDIRHIFEPFYTKKVMGRSGTGLGLAVVWGTVKDHNGFIDVKSEPGKGTVFTLYFPVTREDIPVGPAALPLSDYSGNGEAILVVDDVEEQRQLAAQMLKKLNYHVKTVASGEEAVEYLKTASVDLVILDMIMDPGMDGLDTFIKIREIRNDQKAVIVSGYSSTDRVAQAQALGAGSYVKKPYVMEALGLSVKNELRPR